MDILKRFGIIKAKNARPGEDSASSGTPIDADFFNDNNRALAEKIDKCLSLLDHLRTENSTVFLFMVLMNLLYWVVHLLVSH